MTENTKIADEQALTEALNNLAAVVETINVNNGWVEERTVGDDIALIQSEASEALEAFRDCGDAQKRWYTYTVDYGGVVFKNLSADQANMLLNKAPEEVGVIPKPEGVGSELADIFIRVLNTATRREIPFAAELIEKVHYNATRGYRHGNKHL